uniref:RING-CH-type domain-containing protein n=1 Tax=Rhabditophanes sp. KR3021 TaxID=114890 RepID=A0AC35U105_9BILA
MDRSLHVTSAPPTLNGPGVVDKAKPHPSLHDIKIDEDLMYKSKPLLSPMTPVGEDNNHLDDTNDAICRICYSETGSFINPCDCHGTMGTLHRDCLLEWVQKCGSVHCEMCGHQYASKVCTFKPFLKWSAPNLSRITIIRMLTLLSLFYITFYSLSIMKERKWVERTVKARSVPRPHDLFVLSKWYVVFFHYHLQFLSPPTYSLPLIFSTKLKNVLKSI